MGVAIRKTQGGTVRVGSEFHLPEDSYGAAILAIVKEFTEIRSSDTQATTVNVIRCVFALVILILNLLLQFSCLHFVEFFVVSPSVHHVQTAYQLFHRSVFNELGEFQHEAWQDYPNKDELCQIAMTNKLFYYSILLLWTISCLQEFRTAQRLVVNISHVPHAELGDKMFLDDEDTGHQSVIAITRSVRWMLYIAVCIPKIVISFMLMRLGLRWLSATTSFEDMVMNAIAMNFVVQIDELLYHFALPVHYRKQVADTSIFFDENVESGVVAEFHAYRRSAIYVFAAIIIVVLYAELIQDVLPSTVFEATNHCHNYLHHHLQPVCERPWAQHLKVFTEGLSALSTAHCYPYGADAELQSD